MGTDPLSPALALWLRLVPPWIYQLEKAFHVVLAAQSPQQSLPMEIIPLWS